jgi:hypothetical protein
MKMKLGVMEKMWRRWSYLYCAGIVLFIHGKCDYLIKENAKRREVPNQLPGLN